MKCNWFARTTFFTIIFGVTTLASRIINFICLPIIVAKLDLAQLGVLELYNTIASMSATVVGSLSASGLIRFYYYYQGNISAQRTTIGTSFMVGTFISCGLIPVAVYILFSYYHTFDHLPFFLALMCLNIGLYNMFSLINTYLRVKEKMGAYLVAIIGQNVCALSCTLFLLNIGYGVISCLWGICISCCMFIPYFFYILYTHWSFVYTQFRQHMGYAVPLLFYSIIFSYVINIDKFFLARAGGLQHLGIYGLLWRFGQVFVICSQALMDAWPMVIYRIAKENEKDPLIMRLMGYYALVIACLVFSVTVFSVHCVGFMLPMHRHELALLMPLFFACLGVLDIARLCQTPFNVFNKTFYVPALSCVVIGFQAITFWLCNLQSVQQFLLANNIIFVCYVMLSLYTGNCLNTSIFFSYKRFLSTIVFMYSSQIMIWVLQDASFLTHIFIVLGLYGIGWHLFVGLEDKQSCKNYVIEWVWKWIARAISFKNSNFIPVVLEHSYTHHIHAKRVAIFGPIPPPRGGISIHIQRSSIALQQQNNQVRCIDTVNRARPFIWHLLLLLYNVMRFKPHVLIYHSTYEKHAITELLCIYIYARLQGGKSMIVDHDPRYLDQKSLYAKKLLNMLFVLIDQHIIIGDTTYHSYVNNQIKISESALVESSFLPPDTANVCQLFNAYPKLVKDFVQKHDLLVVVNAYSIALSQGSDVYGIDLCVDLMYRLQPKYPELGMIISYVNVFDKIYFQDLSVRARGLNNRFMFFHNDQEFWPLLCYASVFIRPTRSDSLGISIAESIYVKTPAVASNVCARPRGTILFEKNNLNELVAKTDQLLHHTLHNSIKPTHLSL